MGSRGSKVSKESKFSDLKQAINVIEARLADIESEFAQIAVEMKATDTRFNNLQSDMNRMSGSITNLNRALGITATPSIRRAQYARECIKKDPNNAVALYMMYLHYKHGLEDVNKNDVFAYDFLERAASLGFAPACIDFSNIARDAHECSMDDFRKIAAYIERALKLVTTNSIPNSWMETIHVFGLYKKYLESTNELNHIKAILTSVKSLYGLYDVKKQKNAQIVKKDELEELESWRRCIATGGAKTC